MYQSQKRCFLLTGKAVDALSTKRTGPLSAVIKGDPDPSGFTIHDTFDHAVASGRGLLIEADGQFEYLSNSGTVRAQAAQQANGFVSDLPEGPVKSELSGLSPLRCLLSVGTGTMTPIDVAFVDDEQKTHVRAAIRLLESKGGEAVAFAALSGLRGYDKALARLVKRVEDLGGTEWRSEEAYAALFPDLIPYSVKPDVPIRPKAPAFGTATDIIAAYIDVARRNEAGIIDDLDTEFLHDYRIALRKIRSVLSLFKGVYSEAQTLELKARFSALMAMTGRLRDLDVYLLDRDDYKALLPKSLHKGLAQLFEAFAAEREAQHDALCQHLQSKAYQKDMARLAKLFDKRKKLEPGATADTPVLAFANALIWKRYRKICKIGGAIDATTPDDDVHELRIQCKKLRYLMEFFRPVYDQGDLKRLIKSLKRLQDNLGYFNDYSVQQDSLRAFLDGADKTAHDMELVQSVGALIAILHQRQIEERQKVMNNFKGFNGADTQTSFRTLFHGGKA